MGANLSKTSRETLKNLSNPASFLLVEILESSFFRTSLERVFSGPYFPVFGLNADIHSVRIIQSEYGKIRAKKTPRQVKELIPFENDLVELIRNMKFRKIKNSFHEKLKEDIKLIKDSHKTMTFADKTSNMYRLTKEQYDKLIMNSITSTYKKTNSNIKKQISKAH